MDCGTAFLLQYSHPMERRIVSGVVKMPCFKRLLALIAILAVLSGGVARGEAGMMDGVVAVVNDRKILYSDVSRSAATEFRKLAQLYSGQDFQAKAEEVYRKALHGMIERAVILASYENPNEEAVNLMVEAQLDEVVQSSFKGDRGALLDALSAEHMSLQDWKNEVRDNILVSMFKRNEVDSKVLLSPSAIRKEYNANLDKYKASDSFQLRVIALSKGESAASADKARQQADAIRQQAVAGGDFVSLQKSASPDDSVGDPEWVGPGDLRPEVAKTVAAMKTGEVSPVLEVGDSLLIVKLEARRAERTVAFEEARAEIERQLKLKEQTRLYDLWIERLRKQVYVKVIQEGMARK